MKACVGGEYSAVRVRQMTSRFLAQRCRQVTRLLSFLVEVEVEALKCDSILSQVVNDGQHEPLFVSSPVSWGQTRGASWRQLYGYD